MWILTSGHTGISKTKMDFKIFKLHSTFLYCSGYIWGYNNTDFQVYSKFNLHPDILNICITININGFSCLIYT